MDAELTDDTVRRLRFYGSGDYATYMQLQQAFDIVTTFDPLSPPDNVNDVLELHNGVLYADGGLLPASISDSERAAVLAKVAHAKKAISLWSRH